MGCKTEYTGERGLPVRMRLATDKTPEGRLHQINDKHPDENRETEPGLQIAFLFHVQIKIC